MTTPTRRWTSNRAAGKAPRLQSGYRSGLEAKVAEALANAGVSAAYEKSKITYEVPARTATYTPDWVLPNGIIIEAKGIFDVADRQKHLLVKSQYPAHDIRFVFSRSAAPLYKGSPTTYADWCSKNGFKYADKLVPLEWTAEPHKQTT